MKNIAHYLEAEAIELGGDYLRTEGELLEVLMQMRRRGVFAELNYSGIFDFCVKKLRFSRAQAFYFKSVAEKALEVPQIKEAIQEGVLTLSQARRIVTVITKENHQDWIQKAVELGQTELERAVSAENPQSHVRDSIQPVSESLSKLTVGIKKEAEEDLDALREILSQKNGKAASREDVIEWALKVTRQKFDPMMKAQRAAARASAATASASKPVQAAKVSLGNPQRKPIPSAVKHSVVLRDKGQCTHTSKDGRRCEQKRWLDSHHKVEVAKGGQNSVSNLQILCKRHHQIRHSSPVYSFY